MAPDAWVGDCARAGLTLAVVEPVDGGPAALDTWLARLVEETDGRMLWVACIEVGRDEQRYIHEVLGRVNTPTGRGRPTVIALTGTETRLLIENGLGDLGDSTLMLVDDAACDAAMQALALGDRSRPLANAGACIVRGRGSASAVVGIRPGSAPAMAATLDQLPTVAGPVVVSPSTRATAPFRLVSSPSLALIALVLATIAGSGSATLQAGSTATAPESPTTSVAARQTPASEGDVFAIAGVTLAPASASHGSVSGGQALSIASRDVQRRIGPRARVSSVATFLADATGPANRPCLCWVLRMSVVRQPPCPPTDVREGLGYLVDADSGLITEIVDVVVVGATPAPCGA